MMGGTCKRRLMLSRLQLAVGPGSFLLTIVGVMLKYRLFDVDGEEKRTFCPPVTRRTAGSQRKGGAGGPLSGFTFIVIFAEVETNQSNGETATCKTEQKIQNW